MRRQDDRYHDRGVPSTYFHAQQLADFQSTLEGPYREQFAQADRQNSEMLLTAGRRQQPNRKQFPPQVPQPLPRLDIRHFSDKSKTRRGMTAREAAEAEEQNAAKKRRAVEKNQCLLEVGVAKAKARAAAAKAEATSEDGDANNEASSEDLHNELVSKMAEPNGDLSSDEVVKDLAAEDLPPPSSRRSTRETRKSRKLQRQRKRRRRQRDLRLGRSRSSRSLSLKTF